MDQSYLNTYFSKTWRPNFKQYRFSGYSLIDRIKPGEWVLDVGCGINPFKGLIQNLIGIDPANDAADIKCRIEEFKPDRLYDVAFCLGSINFGQEITIKTQIQRVWDCLKPDGRIYWRCNPGVADHNNKECQEIKFYPWSFNKHEELSKFFHCKILDLQWDEGNRIYAEWQKLPSRSNI